MATIKTFVRALRSRAGLQQQDLAARIGVSRQSLGLIESGATVPSTALALELAAALGCRVEDLFVLAAPPSPLSARLGRPRDGAPLHPLAPGARVRLGMVDGAWIAYPLEGDTPALATTPADGLLSRRKGDVRPLRALEDLRANLLVAGCDPALGVLAGHLAGGPARVQVHWIETSSQAALVALAAGEVHLAGVHLHDDDSGEQNVAPVRRRLGERALLLVNLAVWQQGFVARRDRIGAYRNVKALGARTRVALRETGSGARALFDRLLAAAGMDVGDLTVAETAYTHHAVARSVASGRADVGIATEVAAAAFGLGFQPLAEDRFDLVMAAEIAASSSGQRLLDVLASGRFRKDAGALPGYRTGATGKVIARLAA